MSGALYYLGLAFLFTHELDGVTHSEWRLLPGLSSLPDAQASFWFVALHVPLFFLVLWLSDHPKEVVRERVRALVASFFVLHALLHFALSARPENEFHGGLSHVLIVSAGVCGLAYLVLYFAPRIGSRVTDG